MSDDSEIIKILVIEDSQSFASAVTALIQFCSPVRPHVVVAERLHDGLGQLENADKNLVFLDLNLPDSQGLNTLTAVASKAPKVPIVVISGIDDDVKALDALKLGAQDYLLKGDINARHLSRTIAYAIERKRLQALETERIKLYEQREDFMATLTHDLKNPLIGSNRLLELIADGNVGDISNEIRALLCKIRDSNNALLAMISNLVEVYRYEKDVGSLLRENTNLGRLVANYLNQIEPLTQNRGVTLLAKIQDCVTPVYADQSAIVRVVQNLVDNAIKFSPPGSPVEVRLWEEENSAVFQVSDRGPGIAADEKKRLFQRFWQGRSGKSYSSGTGLGLYLCRQIVEAHNGQIWCQSEESQGATFTVCLPLAKQ